MPKFNAEGVVFRLRDRGEADQLVTLFTPSGGPLRAMARQAKWSVRRFGGRLGLLNRLNFTWSRKEPAAMAYLEDTELIERFPKIPADPKVFGRCMVLAELLAAAWGEGDPAEEPYAFMLDYLRRADASKMDADRHLLEAFRLLGILGHRPSLSGCVLCGGQPGRGSRYSVLDGGVVCANCLAERPQAEPQSRLMFKIQPETLKTIDAGLGMKAEKLGRLKFAERGRKEADEIWIAHVRVLLGRTPLSYEFMEKMES